MLSRHLRRVRAWWASGFLLAALTGAGALADEPKGSVPGPEDAPETVEILKARDAGDLAVTVRGQGEDHVKFRVVNKSGRRLNVILPPGLVAASSAGQAAGGAAGGGFQSMGLGTPTRYNGSFGQFRGGDSDVQAGFRSLAPKPEAPEGIAVGAGQTAEFSLPSVCLNFGIPTPTPKDEFRLMDVNEYTPDLRVRKALRSLSTLGTSQVVAQAVMWNVANGMSFPQLAMQNVRPINPYELSVAARFIEALDGSGSSELIDPSQFAQARLYVRLAGDGQASKDAHRLRSELKGRRLLGLPIELIEENEVPTPVPSTLHLNVALAPSGKGGVKVKATLRHAPVSGGWVVIGSAEGKLDGSLGNLEPSALLDGVERARRLRVRLDPDRPEVGRIDDGRDPEPSADDAGRRDPPHRQGDRLPPRPLPRRRHRPGAGDDGPGPGADGGRRSGGPERALRSGSRLRTRRCRAPTSRRSASSRRIALLAEIPCSTGSAAG